MAGTATGAGSRASTSNSIIAVDAVEGEIVFMHPVARRDVRGGKADDLAEFQGRLILRDRPHRRLVAVVVCAG